MSNRLAGSRSTYLQQHADNPVDWWEWGPEAFAEARRRDVPVFLSVGYASCHWCHVMAHESFEDEVTAAELNAGFVPVKVDREERPDVDALSMAATQALTGQGGWPTTVFLTPDGEPFHAGTYYPPTPRGGLPSLRQLLSAVTTAWTDDRDRVAAAAGEITAALRTAPVRPEVADLPTASVLDRAAAHILGDLDPVHGGFRGAPKFPPTMACEFWLRAYERTGSPELLSAVTASLDGMSRGGLHDQLDGGFARYSVDARWHVPHFEKMLDDNAQLLRVLAHHARLTGDPRSLATARSTAAFLLRELRTDEGLFAVALDADTDGAEGATYVWSDDDLVAALGAADAAAATRWFGLDDEPPAEVDGHVLRLPRDPDVAERARFEQVRATLSAVRQQRPQPERDDIVVLRSTALAVVALAEAGGALGESSWIDAAARALDAAWQLHRVDGTWRRSSRGGQVGPGPAVLADVAGLAVAMLAVHQVRPGEWLDRAVELLDSVLREHRAEDGGFHDTASGDGDLVIRPRDPVDGVAPSGLSSLAEALLTASALTDRGDLRDEAEAILSSMAGLIAGAPRAATWYLAVAEAALAGPLQIAVATDDLDSPLVAEARRLAPGGAVVVAGAPDSQPLLAGRPLLDGREAVYVCRHFTCDRPVTDTAALAAVLGRDADAR